MSLTLDDEIKVRLERTRESIGREFDQLPQTEIDERFDEIVAMLLSEASFGDFVPVLAWRYSRQVLNTCVEIPAEFRE